MQYIFVRDLAVETIIGVHEKERRSSQTLSFDIEIGIPGRMAFVSDRLSDTIDYAQVAALVQRELEDHPFTLLERLAQHLCDRIQAEFKVDWIRMSIAKNTVVAGARQVGVVLEVGERH